MDSKRSTGRSTRMFWAVGEYLVKNPNRMAEVVIATANAHNFFDQQARSLLSADLVERIDFVPYARYISKGRGKRDFTFIDHHCYEEDYLRVAKQLALIEEGYTKYDN